MCLTTSPDALRAEFQKLLRERAALVEDCAALREATAEQREKMSQLRASALKAIQDVYPI